MYALVPKVTCHLPAACMFICGECCVGAVWPALWLKMLLDAPVFTVAVGVRVYDDEYIDEPAW